MKTYGRVQGYLLVSAVILIVVMGFLGLVVTNLVAVSRASTTDKYDSTRAFFQATSGLEYAAYQLLRPDTENRVACSALSFSGVSFDTGDKTFGGQGTLYNPAPAATLTSNINAVDSIIPISNGTDYSPTGGRVMVDQESMDYIDIGTDVLSCSPQTPPCLLGVSRGRDDTTATIHNSGAAVAQNQCNVEVYGMLPNQRGKRSLRDIVQLQKSWIVGAKNNNNLTVYSRESSGAWLPETITGISTQNVKDLHAMSALNYSDIWAVGQKTNNKPLIVHWDGSNWSLASYGTISNKDLHDIYCLNSSNCWAVGDSGNIWQYAGTAWNYITSPGNENLNAITCTATNNCWAGGNSGEIVYYNGSSWNVATNKTPDVNKTINGMTCTATDNCWAVADNGIIYHYDGSNWSEAEDMGSQAINAITCPAENFCLAAGNHGYIYKYDGNDWTPTNIGTIVTLNGIGCASQSDCWVVGDSGSTFHYDGTNWLELPGLPNVRLFDVTTISSQQPHSRWIEEEAIP